MEHAAIAAHRARIFARARACAAFALLVLELSSSPEVRRAAPHATSRTPLLLREILGLQCLGRHPIGRPRAEVTRGGGVRLAPDGGERVVPHASTLGGA